MALHQNEHIISANNILVGLSEFVTLTLPADWRITRSYLQPDVHCNVRRGANLWVQAGQTDQIVFHPSRRVALDLTIVVKRGDRKGFKNKDVDIYSQGSMMVNGHEASYLLGEVGVGFLKRKRARTLRLSIPCSELDRSLMISFTGKCQEADLLEILESLPESRCH